MSWKKIVFKLENNIDNRVAFSDVVFLYWKTALSKQTLIRDAIIRLYNMFSFVWPVTLLTELETDYFAHRGIGIYQLIIPVDLDEAIKEMIDAINNISDDASAPAESVPVKINPKNNDGRTTCFKCGGKLMHIDSGFSFYDICPKCKI